MPRRGRTTCSTGTSGLTCKTARICGNRETYATPAYRFVATPRDLATYVHYGAGHATVAGACVTILKAWFDCGQPLADGAGAPIAFVAKADGSALDDVSAGLAAPLTIEGELNKRAGNIAIGRNWGGVHYYSDYIESLRLGEQIAVGLLQEQKLTYKENFSMTVPLFDGTSMRV